MQLSKSNNKGAIKCLAAIDNKKNKKVNMFSMWLCFVRYGGEIKLLAFVSLLTSLLLGQTSCKKLVEVDPPPTKPDAAVVYSKDATATAVLTGLYNRMSGRQVDFATGANSISLIAGLSADELTAYSGTSGTLLFQAYQNSLTSNNVPFWFNLYNCIYTANTALEGVSASETLTPKVKQQLLGEAKFMRAFFYFYLVNLWGDVPLITNSDYKQNAVAGRTSKDQVYLQIERDLLEAQDLLSDNFISLDLSTVTTERIRPTKWAAIALLARVYLYMGKYSNAETQSTYIISNSTLFDTTSLGSVFVKNNKEAIWQLQPVIAGWNTEDARTFILTGAPSSTQPVSISNSLFNSFEVGDKRKVNWIKSINVGSTTYYYPYKYQSATQNASINEYLMVLRLGEQYLIRAEARAQQDNINGGVSDLNIIRRRAGLLGVAPNDKPSLLSSIWHERQIELFTEWGHRWLDLKRSGNVEQVMPTVATQKGTTWSTNWKLYPLLLFDIQNNPSLAGQQNPGY